MRRVGFILLFVAAARAQDAASRLERLRQLEASREKALAAVPYLVSLLEDPRIGARARTLILELGPDAWPALAKTGTMGFVPTSSEAFVDVLVACGEGIIPTLVSHLEFARGAVTTALVAFGEKSVGPLEKVVRERKAEGWPAAAAVLGEMRAVALPALPALREALASREARSDVALAIARITADAEERRRMLLEALRSARRLPEDPLLDELAREGAALKDAAPLLWPFAEGGPRAPSPLLLTALWRMDGDAPRVLAIVVPAMVAESPDFSADAAARQYADLLREMKGAARPASEALLELLARDRYSPDRGQLLAALERTGIDPALVPRLRGWLRGGQDLPAQVALGALALMGPEAGPAVPDVARLLTHKEERLREAGAEWLDESRLPPAALARGLAAALDGADVALACEICDRLRDIGEEATDAVPALRRACKEPGGRAAVRALLACVDIGPGAVAMVPEALAALESNEEEPAWAGASALRSIGKAAGACAPDLLRIMGKKPTSGGLWAASSLLKVAPGHEKAVARYAGSCLAVEFLRGGALWTLAETGDASRPYLDRARALLKEKSAVTRVCAAYLLASRKASMPAAMKVLEEVLRSGDRRGIQEACRAAARLGPTAKPLEKALRDLRSKGKLDAEQKEDVQEALDAIG